MKILTRLWSLAVSSSALVFMGLASLPQNASALATFELAISGPGLAPPPGFFCSPPIGPDCQPMPFRWHGTVTLVTTGVADGIYTGASFVSLSIVSNVFSAQTPGLNMVFYQAIPGYFASVTLLNRRVAGFEFASTDPPFPDVEEDVIFSGMGASYFACCGHHGGEIDATAVLTNIPEPEIVSLMLAGLLLASLMRRSRKSAHASRGARDSANAGDHHPLAASPARGVIPNLRHFARERVDQRLRWTTAP